MMTSLRKWFRSACVLTSLAGGLAFALPAHAQETTGASVKEPVESGSEVAKSSVSALPDASSAAVPDLAYGAYQRGYYLTAFELALPRAKLGDPAAQTLIAEIYDKGLGVPKDPKEAAAWYEIAARNGDTEAKFGFAVKLLEGRDVKPDRERARELLGEAADAGHSTASLNYAQLLINDRPTTKGYTDALPYLEYAAENDVAEAYYLLAQVYQSGRLKGYPETEKANEWLTRAARAGIEEAQVELGIRLANGEVGDPDPKAGFRWIRRAARSGNVVARNRLAVMFAKGVGTSADAVEAAKWHILAKRAGLSDPWLDIYVNSLEGDVLSEGLAAANRWPG